MVASHPATLKLCDFLEGSQRCSAGEGGHWGDRPQILLFHHRPWVKIPYLSDCIGFWDDQYWPAIFALDLQKNQFREKVKPWVGRAQKYQLRKVDGFNFIPDVLSPSSDGNWIIWATQWHKPTYIPFEMVYTPIYDEIWAWFMALGLPHYWFDLQFLLLTLKRDSGCGQIWGSCGSKPKSGEDPVSSAGYRTATSRKAGNHPSMASNLLLHLFRMEI